MPAGVDANLRQRLPHRLLREAFAGHVADDARDGPDVRGMPVTLDVGGERRPAAAEIVDRGKRLLGRAVRYLAALEIVAHPQDSPRRTTAALRDVLRDPAVIEQA